MTNKQMDDGKDPDLNVLQAQMRSRRIKGEAEEKSKVDDVKVSDDAEPAAKTVAYVAEHTVESGDTLSGIAQQYYNSQAREKWMAIYEANKEVIGDNPSLIRVGQVLKIPEL